MRMIGQQRVLPVEPGRHERILGEVLRRIRRRQRDGDHEVGHREPEQNEHEQLAAHHGNSRSSIAIDPDPGNSPSLPADRPEARRAGSAPTSTSVARGDRNCAARNAIAGAYPSDEK